MTEVAEQPVLDFYAYPSVGDDDWQYAFQTAVVRALDVQMLSRALLLDMANAESFEAAVDLLSSTEYASVQAGRSGSVMEEGLMLRRSAVRELFADLMLDEQIVKLFRARDDFANVRLALRRQMTEKAIGTDYSNDGNVPAEGFEEIFKEESASSALPDYMQEATDEAVLAYYQNKDIRQIDYAIDRVQAGYKLRSARQLNSEMSQPIFTNAFGARVMPACAPAMFSKRYSWLPHSVSRRSPLSRMTTRRRVYQAAAAQMASPNTQSDQKMIVT